MPLDPQLKDMLAFIESAGYPPMEEGTPAAARQGFRVMAVDMVKPEDVVPVGSVEELTVPGGAGERDARLYKPEGDGPWPTLVYLHGGGFVVGDLDTHDQTCRRICRDADIAVLSVDYRLAPEDPFPAGLEDALTATEWAAAHLADLGGDDRLAVGGDSAGGNLSAVVAPAPRRRAGRPDAHLPGHRRRRRLPLQGGERRGPLPHHAAMMQWFSDHYVPADTDLAAELHRIAPLHGDHSEVAPGARRHRRVRPAARRGRGVRRRRCAPPASPSSRSATTG